jgi:hypothetical protein
MKNAMTKKVEAQIRSFFSDHAVASLAGDAAKVHYSVRARWEMRLEDETAMMKRDGLL